MSPRRSSALFWLFEISGSRATCMSVLPFYFLRSLCSQHPHPTKKTKSIHFNAPNEMDAIVQQYKQFTWKYKKMKTCNGLLFPSSCIHSFIHSLGFAFFVRRSHVQLTERAPVMRALCVRVAGRRRWYPISGVPLLDGGFKMVSRLALLGALIDALRVFCRPAPCGGVDS